MSRTGLVIEGGGMRGIYATGVLDEMLDQGFKADGLVGVSAGIIHGVSYVSEQYGRNIRYFLKYRHNDRFMSFKSFIRTKNLCEIDFCYDDIPNRLSVFDYERFAERAKDIETYATVTNLHTGKAEYIRIFDLKEQMDVVRASASLPIISEKVYIDGVPYLDGGSSDSIPLKFMQEQGYDDCIVITTRPAGYKKKPDKTMPLMKMIYKDYPEYLDTCENRHIVYNEQLEYIDKAEKAGEISVIRPSRSLDVGRMEKDLNKVKRLYKLGRYDAKNFLSKMC